MDNNIIKIYILIITKSLKTYGLSNKGFNILYLNTIKII
jgi:hypothetical protein